MSIFNQWIVEESVVLGVRMLMKGDKIIIHKNGDNFRIEVWNSKQKSRIVSKKTFFNNLLRIFSLENYTVCNYSYTEENLFENYLKSLVKEYFNDTN